MTTEATGNRYVVAFSQSEAESLADAIAWDTKAEANKHLARVQAPPTDPFYAEKYSVYTVARTR